MGEAARGSVASSDLMIVPADDEREPEPRLREARILAEALVRDGDDEVHLLGAPQAGAELGGGGQHGVDLDALEVAHLEADFAVEQETNQGNAATTGCGYNVVLVQFRVLEAFHVGIEPLSAEFIDSPLQFWYSDIGLVIAKAGMRDWDPIEAIDHPLS